MQFLVHNDDLLFFTEHEKTNESIRETHEKLYGQQAYEIDKKSSRYIHRGSQDVFVISTFFMLYTQLEYIVDNACYDHSLMTA